MSKRKQKTPSLRVLAMALQRIGETTGTLGDFAKWAKGQAELADVLKVQESANGKTAGLSVAWTDPDGETGIMAATIWKAVKLKDAADVERWQRGQWSMMDGIGYTLELDNTKKAKAKIKDVLNRWIAAAKHDKKTTATAQNRKISEAARDIYSALSQAKRRGQKMTIDRAICEYRDEHNYLPLSNASIKKQLTILREQHAARKKKRQ